MSLADASNPEKMGAVFDKLDAWRKLDERNHINETPTTVVGGRRVVVGSPEFYQAKADDIGASNFERADARRIRDANMQLERDLRRAPPVILQPGVRAYREDGTLIGEGIDLPVAPQSVPAPVSFGNGAGAVPNGNGGWDVSRPTVVPEVPKPIALPNGDVMMPDGNGGYSRNEATRRPEAPKPAQAYKPGERILNGDGTFTEVPGAPSDIDRQIDTLNQEYARATMEGQRQAILARIRQLEQTKAAQQEPQGGGTGRPKY